MVRKARPVECECTYNFTCGHCLRNAPPYFFTPSTCEEQQLLRDAVAIAAELEPDMVRK